MLEACLAYRRKEKNIKVHVIPYSDVCAMLNNGWIANAPAIVALQWLQLNHTQTVSS